MSLSLNPAPVQRNASPFIPFYANHNGIAAQTDTWRVHEKSLFRALPNGSAIGSGFEHLRMVEDGCEPENNDQRTQLHPQTPKVKRELRYAFGKRDLEYRLREKLIEGAQKKNFWRRGLKCRNFDRTGDGKQGSFESNQKFISSVEMLAELNCIEELICVSGVEVNARSVELSWVRWAQWGWISSSFGWVGLNCVSCVSLSELDWVGCVQRSWISVEFTMFQFNWLQSAFSWLQLSLILKLFESIASLFEASAPRLCRILLVVFSCVAATSEEVLPCQELCGQAGHAHHQPCPGEQWAFHPPLPKNEWNCIPAEPSFGKKGNQPAKWLQLERPKNSAIV